MANDVQQCEIKVFERRGRKLLVDGFRHLSKQIALVTRIRVVEIIKNCDFKLSWRLTVQSFLKKRVIYKTKYLRSMEIDVSVSLRSMSPRIKRRRRLNSGVWKRKDRLTQVQFASMNRFLPYHSNTLVLLTVLACNTPKYIVSLSSCTFAALPKPISPNSVHQQQSGWNVEQKRGTKDKRCIFFERECIFIYTPRDIDICIKRNVFQLGNVNFSSLVISL